MRESTGVVLLHFGEPENPVAEEVRPFLERIFATNASLEAHGSAEALTARTRELAAQRTPGLVAEYEEIGGSPMNAQARAHAENLRAVLARRGHEVRTYSAFQFTDPLPAEVVERAAADGVRRLIGLPVYPLCGPSTTVAALAALRSAVDAFPHELELREIAGWHPHPLYTRLRAEGIRATVRAGGIDLADARVALVFSAHGTPLQYLREGSRYDRYVAESCRAVAHAAGVTEYVIGFQNHTNRPVEWTQPDIEQVIRDMDADHVVVVPISFMHEQSETLAELDHELRDLAESRCLGFHRVPVPHDDPRFADVLADLCEPYLDDDTPHDAAGLPLRACLCRPGAFCLNGRA